MMAAAEKDGGCFRGVVRVRLFDALRPYVSKSDSKKHDLEDQSGQIPAQLTLLSFVPLAIVGGLSGFEVRGSTSARFYAGLVSIWYGIRRDRAYDKI